MNFKKRLCKTFAVLGACMLLAGAVVSFPATNVSAQAVTSEEKTIDMYLIAGQSNAAGYSSKGRKLDGVFENVSYAGEVDRYRSNGNASQSYLEYPFQSAVKEGLGRASGFVGPEYGIAEKLNEKYKGGALLQKTITVGFLGKARNSCLSEDAEYVPVPLGKLRLRKRPRQ